jgi:hypothetical protein
MSEQSFISETQIVRRVAGNPKCRWSYTRHAEHRMIERGITASDIENVLINGQVMMQENKQDILWRVQGRDLDGRWVRVIVAVREYEIKIKVVTVF